MEGKKKQQPRRQLYSCNNRIKRDKRKLRIPHPRDVKEIRKLMKRPLPDLSEDSGFCVLCSADDHFYTKCPWLDKIPPGQVVGHPFDAICIGCGTIGEDCCYKGQYAYFKFCSVCGHSGHWYWENICQLSLPWMPELPSQNEEEDDELKYGVGSGYGDGCDFLGSWKSDTASDSDSDSGSGTCTSVTIRDLAEINNEPKLEREKESLKGRLKAVEEKLDQLRREKSGKVKLEEVDEPGVGPACQIGEHSHHSM